MTAFFANDQALDPHYVALRDGDAPIVQEARAFVEMLWASFSQYLDPDVPARAARDSYFSCFWELYLAYTLDTIGIKLVPRDEREPARHGPDLLAMQPKVWIEAVAPGRGQGADAVQESSLGGVFSVPDEQIKLRLRSSIEEKRLQLQRYTEHGWVAPGDPVVVAINGKRIPSAQLEITIPRIIRCVIPFGHERFLIDPHNAEVLDRSFAYQPEILKQSGGSVPTDVFLDPQYASISALLYCCDIFYYQ